MNIDTLISDLQLLQKSIGQPCVVSIDGKSGVGKSTFARTLGSRLKATIISGDDFYSGGVLINEHSSEKLAELCINRAKILLALEALKLGQSFSFYPFDWSSFSGSLSAEKKKIEPSNFVILEGVYSNHIDLRSFVDQSILLKISEDERKRRLVKREGQISDWSKYWASAENWYFTNISLQESFDKVVENI